MPGTPHETGVFVSGEPGPTALVVGGIHGEERPGYLAAGRFAGVEPAVGRVVVIPRANRTAVEAGNRTGGRGDLNEEFPTGRRPTTPLGRAIWGVVDRYDPDVVVDLHRSLGIYRLHDGAVGQAIYPTDAAGARAVARDVADTLNDDVVPWAMPLHDFRVGNDLEGSRPMLVHKVGGDLDRPGYIVETTRFLVDVRTQADWLTRATVELLAGHGVDYGGDSSVGVDGRWS